ncbi:unnamed protein product, partial [Symbiodinium pilosum]
EHILKVLPSLSELVLHEGAEPPPPPVALKTQTCQCWSCWEGFWKPKTEILARRAGATVRDQQLQLAKMRSHTHAVIKHEARKRVSRLNWANQA